ncbi:MAG: alkaline phosphatase [Clostridia bacterium]|nr:alkaline phosphatase [Clostridia bacterium]
MKTRKITSLFLVLLLVFSAAAPFVYAEDAGAAEYKNVIIMIGDGMGENHLELAKEQGYELFMEDAADERGQSETRSFSHKVTDSAAGATALSCGVRNINGQVCVYAFDPLGFLVRPKIITEAAIEHGMKTGVVTSDKTTGATPAGFSVHAKSRDDSELITERQLASDLDLIWGAAVDCTDKETVEASGFTYISTKSEMDALGPGSRSFGQFSSDTWRTELPEGDESPLLAEMTVKAIELLDAGDGGFLLMVEGAHIDKNSHRTDGDVYHWDEKAADTANAVKGFDDAIKAAVGFAREDGETLVVVTADHETGDLYEEDGVYTFHSGSHTGKNVPLLVYCCDDLIPNGEAVPNKSVPVRIAGKLGWSKLDFPRSDVGLAFQWLKKLFRS